MAGIVEQNTPFFAVKTLITRLLELDICHNAHEREQLILEHVTDEDTRKNLPLINDLLMVKVCVCLCVCLSVWCVCVCVCVCRNIYVSIYTLLYCILHTVPSNTSHYAHVS